MKMLLTMKVMKNMKVNIAGNEILLFIPLRALSSQRNNIVGTDLLSNLHQI